MEYPKIYLLGRISQSAIDADEQIHDLHVPRRQTQRLSRPHQMRGLGGLLVLTEGFAREHLTEAERDLLWSRLPGDIGIKPAYRAILLLLDGWDNQPPGEGHLVSSVLDYVFKTAVHVHGVEGR